MKESEFENDVVMRNRRNMSKDNVDRKRRKTSKDIVGPKRSKASKDIVDPKRSKVAKDVIGPKAGKVTDAKRREVSRDIVDSKSRKVFEDIVDPKYLKVRLKYRNPSSVNKASKQNSNMDDLSKVPGSMSMSPLTSEITRAATMNVQSAEQKKVLDMPKSSEFLHKLDISGLCDVLHLSENVKAVAIRFLEHILKHYNVNCQEVSTMEAFEISVCWLAAYLLKHKIDREESLALAKLHLNFDCKEEEATYVYKKLQKLKKVFSSYLENGLNVEKCNINGALDSKIPELKDLAEEGKQKDFQAPQISNIVESATIATIEHDLQRKSPTTVLSLQDQTSTENFNGGPSTAPKICLSRKTPGSLPMEADTISSDSEGDIMSALASTTAEVSFLEGQNKVSNSSNDPYHFNPVKGSLERQSPVTSTDGTWSVGEVCEDPQILANEVVASDNSMTMSTLPVQFNSADTDAVTYNSTAVTKVRQWSSVVSPVCGESTTLESAETTVPFMQPSHADLWPLHQMVMSAIPSYFEDNSANTAMPQDIHFYLSNGDPYNINEDDVILQAPNDSVEPFNSSLVSLVPQLPSSGVPMNETTIHSPCSITNPGYVSCDPFQAHSMTSEMPHISYADPLLIEMERIDKLKEEASKMHEKKMLQLQSDYKKEFEKLGEKYKMLLQDVNTAVALKRKELETHCKIVLLNKVLAKVWFHKLDCCERAASQCTEQVARPSSSSSHVSRYQTYHMPAQRIEQCMAGPPVIHPSCTATEVVNPSATIPEINPGRACFNPMLQFPSNLPNGYDLLALAPYLGASTASSSYSVPLLPNE